MWFISFRLEATEIEIALWQGLSFSTIYANTYLSALRTTWPLSDVRVWPSTSCNNHPSPLQNLGRSLLKFYGLMTLWELSSPDRALNIPFSAIEPFEKDASASFIPDMICPSFRTAIQTQRVPPFKIKSKYSLLSTIIYCLESHSVPYDTSHN